MSLPPDPARLQLERDLFLRLLELGARDALRPFLEDALALITSVTGASRGYIELSGEASSPERVTPFWLGKGFRDDELEAVRQEISRGIVAEALATGRTVNTASAVVDPRFAGQASVQARRIHAVLCAPIGTPALGVLYLQGRAAPGPFSPEDLSHAELFARHLAPLADRLLEKVAAESRADATRELRARIQTRGIAGRSRALAEVFRQVLVAAPVPVSVLLLGESGTGKTAIARAIHDSSPRASGPFVEVNCAAIPEGLFESELFGAEKGAHSTATRRVEGKVAAAQRGTLFLDEVAEMPLSVQGKLLTFLQSKRYYRLGGTDALSADVRIVAATNRDLEAFVAERKFREDLFYRLNVLSVFLPPLRQRREDVVPIAEAVLEALGSEHGQPMTLGRGARAALAEAEWPGNVRQLENTLARGWAVALSEGATVVESHHLFPERASVEGSDAAPGGELSFQEATRRFQARLLRETLEANGFNVSDAARRLDLSRSHLNELLRAFGIVREKRP